MPLQRVFVDANVLFSRTLRDWLFLLRHEADGMFQLQTTRDVIAETQYRLRRAFPELPGGVIADLQEKIEAATDEIIRDFDADVPYDGRDRDDLHVHAGALAGQAHILLSEDRGWSGSTGAPYEVLACDEFFVLIDDSAAWVVQSVTDDQRQYWDRRADARRKDLASALVDAGCPNFAVRVRRHLEHARALL